MAKRTLRDELGNLEPNLRSVLGGIAQAVADIAVELRTLSVSTSGELNDFGDTQLKADIRTDQIIFKNLETCGCVETASSEEFPDVRAVGGKGYSVAYDPLDGSSVFPANFAVGSIFGVWPGSLMIGEKGSKQVAAAYGIYGPRTVLVIATPTKDGNFIAREFALRDGDWHLSQERITVGERKYFAPANVRCIGENQAYKDIVFEYMQDRYTLRYSGGMVPDVHHILTKGGGIFCSPSSPTAPAKLRLLYECAPLAFIMEAAGGASIGSRGRTLDQVISEPSERTVICLGSKSEVEKCTPAMEHS